jgi:hypothetical protein
VIDGRLKLYTICALAQPVEPPRGCQLGPNPSGVVCFFCISANIRGRRSDLRARNSAGRFGYFSCEYCNCRANRTCGGERYAGPRNIDINRIFPSGWSSTQWNRGCRWILVFHILGHHSNQRRAALTKRDSYRHRGESSHQCNFRYDFKRVKAEPADTNFHQRQCICVALANKQRCGNANCRRGWNNRRGSKFRRAEQLVAGQL